jgi:branched-chain amino acid transport system ATP-binding protein
MDTVCDISDWVIVMAQGGIVAEGPPEKVMVDETVIDAYLGAHHEAPVSTQEAEAQLAEAEAELREEIAEAETEQERA